MNRREFYRCLLGVGIMVAEPSIAWAQLKPPLRVNGQRLNRQLRALAQFGKNPQGGVSRVAFSQADRQARNYVMELMRAAHLEPSIDAAGNIIGRRAGGDPGLPPLMSGSHIDTVPEGGNYDGTVGSIGAIEVARTLAEHSIATRHPLEVVIFANEEGGKTGSQALIGELSEDDLKLVTHSGKTIREGISFIGGDPTTLGRVRRDPGTIAAFLELHIEQGSILERAGIDIGVVTGIVGIKRWYVEVAGFANHAGTTPMDNRRDALLAAARFIVAVNDTVTGVAGRQVGTVGQIEVSPGAPNVIPGHVTMSLEIRDLDMSKIDRLFEEIRAEARRIAEHSGTTFTFDHFYTTRPAATAERIQQVIAESARELGLTTMRMPSGAGHDAQSIALLAPIGMIFVPSVGGISHSPKEFSRPAEITAGANVLLNTILELDSMRIPG